VFILIPSAFATQAQNDRFLARCPVREFFQQRVFIVIVSFVSRFDLCRHAAALLLVALATAAYGCGSSLLPTDTHAATGAGKGPSEILKPEQLWKYEGTGKAKRKIQISRRERVRLLHEAQQKTN
jgi:hypothetical protein